MRNKAMLTHNQGPGGLDLLRRSLHRGNGFPYVFARRALRVGRKLIGGATADLFAVR